MRRLSWSLVVGGAIGVIVVGLTLGVGIPAAQRTLAKPNITLTDSQFSLKACGYYSGQLQQDAMFTFSLVNTGNADGFAVVNFFLDGKQVAGTSYFVAHGQSVDKTYTYTITYTNTYQCSPHTGESKVASVTKA